jgi:predicted nucleic acid-binding protein
MSQRAVFDCMIFLQAAVTDRGPAFACFELVEAGEVTLYVSPLILSEVRDVLESASFGP